LGCERARDEGQGTAGTRDTRDTRDSRDSRHSRAHAPHSAERVWAGGPTERSNKTQRGDLSAAASGCFHTVRLVVTARDELRAARRAVPPRGLGGELRRDLLPRRGRRAGRTRVTDHSAQRRAQLSRTALGNRRHPASRNHDSLITSFRDTGDLALRPRGGSKHEVRSMRFEACDLKHATRTRAPVSEGAVHSVRTVPAVAAVSAAAGLLTSCSVPQDPKCGPRPPAPQAPAWSPDHSNMPSSSGDASEIAATRPRPGLGRVSAAFRPHPSRFVAFGGAVIGFGTNSPRKSSTESAAEAMSAAA